MMHHQTSAIFAVAASKPVSTSLGAMWLQLITVFDADMVCSPEFFTKTLPRIVDDRVSLVLTPQAYHNYDPSVDIFNHSAFAYWSVMVPGEDAWGHIVCTGQPAFVSFYLLNHSTIVIMMMIVRLNMNDAVVVLVVAAAAAAVVG